VGLNKENRAFEPRLVFLGKGQALMIPSGTIHGGGFKTCCEHRGNDRIHGYAYANRPAEYENKNVFILGQLETPHHPCLSGLPLGNVEKIERKLLPDLYYYFPSRESAGSSKEEADAASKPAPGGSKRLLRSRKQYGKR
jgi:hypothetical protein